MPISNAAILDKIHQTYRTQYLKDVVLPRWGRAGWERTAVVQRKGWPERPCMQGRRLRTRARAMLAHTHAHTMPTHPPPSSLDDATYATLSSLALFNNMEVVSALTADQDFLPRVRAGSRRAGG